MKLLCKMFGHIRYGGWWGDGLYGKVIQTGPDGTGRTHAHITGQCDRCGERYVLARFHPSEL